jgi:hypothetical protein
MPCSNNVIPGLKAWTNWPDDCYCYCHCYCYCYCYCYCHFHCYFLNAFSSVAQCSSDISSKSKREMPAAPA